MALAVAFTFLGYGFHATPWGHHVNEGAVEWPPSPWRLVRAIAAGRARTDPLLDRAALGRWLRPLLAPPSYWVPAASAAHSRHYMPGKTGPDLVLDTFVAVGRDQPVVAMWPTDASELPGLREALELVPYLGRSQSWVSADLVEPRDPNVTPVSELAGRPELGDELELVRLLAPDPGRADEALRGLLLTTTEVHDQRLAVPPGSRWVEYARPPLIPDPLPRRRRYRPIATPAPTVARFLIDSAAPPPVTETILIGDLARRSAMAWFGRLNDGASSPVLSGKDAAGRPLEGHRHAHYVATDEDGDRRLDHLTIVAPAGFAPAEIEALANVRSLEPGRGRPPVRLVLVGFGRPEAFQSPLFGSSTTWRSHTPFIPIRHAKVRGSADARHLVDGPVDQLVLELERRGFPRPTRVRYLRGARWLEFRLHRPRHEPPGAAYGFEIEFEREVRGPIAVGGSSHFGLGLFLPARVTA